MAVLLLFGAARADQRAWTYDSLRQGQKPQSEASPVQPTEEQEVAALLAKMVDRWNAHDIDGYMETLWNSSDLLCVLDGEEVMGWSNLLASYLRGYPDRSAMGSLRVERTLIQPVTQDLACAMDWWTISFGTNPSHSAYATSTYVIRRFPKVGWQICVTHTSFVEP